MKSHKHTVGAVLASQRTKLDREVSDVAARTGLSEQFIIDVESHRYEVLPHDVYTLNGVRKYATELGMEESSIKEQYLGERGDLPRLASLRRSPRHAAPIVTSTWLLRGLVALAALTVVAYIGYQVIAAAGKPQLNVIFPRENQVVYTDEIEVVGRAQAGATVSIDGHRITVADDGGFRYALTLPEGRHTIRVRAENDLGRSSQVTRRFIIQPQPD